MTAITFPKAYEWTKLSGLPSGEEIHRFPSDWPGSSEGVVVRVDPHGKKPWLGNFRLVASEYRSEVLPTPAEHRMCVIAGGQCYIVDVLQPGEYEVLPIVPVTDVRAITEPALLLLADYTHAAAYGKAGVAWESARISWDGLVITRITGQTAFGRAWDPFRKKDKNFTLDLRTGRVTGGSFRRSAEG